MTGGGLSKPRLERLADVMQRHVEQGGVPGLVWAVARRAAVHVGMAGRQSLDGSDLVRRDSIFRISSMTKPVTAVAAMLLVEECRLRLDEPVERLLPELAGRRVLRRLDGPLDDTVPAERPITLRDLLTFRLGLGIVMAPPGTYPIQQAMDDLLLGQGPPAPQVPPAPDEWMRRLGTLPLLHQPGERWMYNTGADVLGVLIARAAGQPLEDFLRERLFAPLGMTDTAFHVPAEKLDRLMTGYGTNFRTGEFCVYDPAAGSQWSRPPAFPSGGGGLVSTIDDYLAFGRMMLNRGRHGKARILSRPAVELMTADQLTPAQKAGPALVPSFWETRGWGFGMAVVTGRDDLSSVPGRFGWDGGLGSSWYADPHEDLVGVLLTQRAWESPNPPPVRRDFWTLAYQAIDD